MTILCDDKTDLFYDANTLSVMSLNCFVMKPQFSDVTTLFCDSAKLFCDLAELFCDITTMFCDGTEFF